MPVVSVILPNHNYADFISDAINSVKYQTLRDLECIIIDDASTDNSVDIIKNLIKDDPRFKLIVLPEAGGVSHARNVGLDCASGEYIAFLDSDDCYTYYALEKLVEVARNTGLDVVGGVTRFVNGHFRWGRTEKREQSDNISIETDLTKVMFAENKQKWIWIWRRIYKRSFLENIRFIEDMKINGDDIMFVLDFGWKLKKFAETSIITVLHRIHPLSVSAVTRDINRERLVVFPKMFRHIKESIIAKYNRRFLCKLYDDLFSYMCDECLFKHNISEEDSIFIRGILKESCKLIPRKYLTFKHRLLCGYMSWI